MKSDRLGTVAKPRQNLLIGLLLGFVTLVIYGQVGGFDFTNYDDPVVIYANPVVSRGLTLRGLWWGLSTTYFDSWHPVSWWSHMLDCELFDLRPGGPHLVNLGLHIANALLLFGILRRMTGAAGRSAVVAALFAWHPLHVESVAWLAERKDVLSTCFWLLALWAYVNFVKLSGAAKKPAGRHFYWLTFLFFGLGLMTKAMVVTFPFVLLLLDHWPLRRLAGFKIPATGGSLIGGWWSNWRPLVVEKLPLFGLSLAMSVVTYWSMQHSGNIYSGAEISWGFRLANVPISYAHYLGKLVWPTQLAAYYPSPAHWEWRRTGGAVGLLLLISLVAIRRARSAPYLITGWLFFLGTLVPVIGIVAMSQQAMADRYTYVPSIGIFMAVVWVAGTLAERHGQWQNLLRVAALAGLLACAGLTWVQVGHWRDSFTLWRHCLAVNPDNVLAHYNLGCALQKEHDLTGAREQFRMTLELQPDHAEANVNLGTLCLEEGRTTEAVGYLARALKLKPNDPQAHPKAHGKLGQAFYKLGDYQAAAEHYALALEADPADEKTLCAQAETLLELADNTGALAAADRAITLAPGDHWAHIVKGRALSALGRSEDALQCYYAALRLEPANPATLNNLAWVLATCPEDGVRNGEEAVRLAERACELTANRQPVYIGTLAAAWAEAGRFDKARQAAQTAAELAQTLGETNRYEQNRELLRLFDERKPYRSSN